MAGAALTAWWLGAGERYREAAVTTVSALAARLLEQPFAHGTLLRVAAGLAVPPRQLVVVTGARDSALAVVARGADAEAVAVVTTEQARLSPMPGSTCSRGRTRRPERAYDCRAFVCRLPVSDPAEVSFTR